MAAASADPFKLEVSINPTGWGPTKDSVPKEFVGKPFQAFKLSDSLGTVADFTGKHHNRRWRNAQFEGLAPQDDFKIVDTSKKDHAWTGRRTRRYKGRRKNDPQTNKGGDMQKISRTVAKTRFNRRKQKIWNSRRFRRQEKKDRGTQEFSVKPQTDWPMVEEYDLGSFHKLTTTVPEVEDINNGFFGELEYYDEEYERVSVKKPRSLQRLDKRMFFYVATCDDEVIEMLAKLGVGNVFGTDAILSQLMASARSVNAWDVIVRRIGKSHLFFDKRDESACDLVTVNETAFNPPLPTDKEVDKRPMTLAVEATVINQNFSQQVLKKGEGVPKLTFGNPNPFFDPEEQEEGQEAAAVAYRYRKWKMSEDITLVARTELHGAVKKGKQDLKMTCFALNEYDPRVTRKNAWRNKLDSQRGAVLATELQNNACKLAKWTTQTLLSGADLMKIGYVSRVSAKDPTMHTILGTQFYKPNEFAKQINLNPNNVWGVLRKIIDDCMKQPEGKYLLLKDPNKKSLYLYKISDHPTDD